MSLEMIEEMLEDPDKRAKLYLIIAGIQILVPISITIGTILFILIKLGII